MNEQEFCFATKYAFKGQMLRPTSRLHLIRSFQRLGAPDHLPAPSNRLDCQRVGKSLQILL